ncbi:MAG: hypothetical protein EZS28_014741 [Streblomastix strix]|uniref:Uncharacterized protein n=1 Tax=Streblomastix strix TaxID=222440 RepID=A0A5J4W5B7_9EUKA|nr:MAG: hypothetical protein EZS28_014741 [Streblomastix strix]
MLSLTFDTDLMNNHMLHLNRKAISAHMIVKPKYGDSQNVGILFDYCRGKGSNRNLANIEIQSKLNSFLMAICSMRPAKIDGKSLSYSVICEKIVQEDLRLQTKTKSGLYSRKHLKIRDQTVSPRATFFGWVQRIGYKFGQSIRNNKFNALWRNEDITIPAKRGQISHRLKKFLDLMGVCESITALYILYIFFITSPFNLLEMPSCNTDKQEDGLMTMVSKKLMGMRCKQPFMDGYAQAVR